MAKPTDLESDMPLNIIGENLIIKDGVIVCRDGTQLKEYLAKFNFKDGDAVNVISNEGLKKLNFEAELGYYHCA